MNRYNFSPKLRIQLAGFMHDNLKVKQQSLQELMIADSCKPSYIDEFIIFYLKYFMRKLIKLVLFLY